MKLTENAAQAVHKILVAGEKSPEKTYLRVAIVGSRCSGPVYSFNLDEEYNGDVDHLVEQDGLKIVHEKIYSDALQPVVVDYAEIEDRKGFTFTNPLAVLGGGCSSGGCSSGGCGSH